ncbi:AI-2E family transporter [Aeromicrobium duanguangcaii]|uniref:AI-2E family transporter n=1 Tax=Aeromicrobium duanguangcaii TaxID=2968086 RepID=A0ABY5KJI4_9ACTN|nr:AI-2E family transporter [Aeromicrobium duanguangcaii]MCD9153762.1 AI-2E family transporter [Aeromicrobium duanguangcaii]MCL3836253.1 AI-2E family transporter [Aeromicrobium duanguangcaii]UUI69160.1 AI-2E family transporter [Aeromicrobium duanguangcaii]
MSSESRGAGRYEIPIGVEIAAAWAWRLVLLGAAGYLLIRVLGYFSEVTVPIAIAALLAALTVGAVDWLARHGVPRLAAALTVVLGLLLTVIGLIGVVGQQLSTQFDDLRDSVIQGIDQVQNWARTGPLDLSDRQLDNWIDRLEKAISSSDSAIFSQATEVGVQIGHFVAGFLVTFFTLFFFLYEGARIWGWIVRLFPRVARERVDSSGHAAWGSLTAFVRATVLVALADAVGIAGVALILQVPLAAAIGVLVFLGAFIPIIGATLSGLVAVLVALVAQGPVAALVMLAGVIAVQQIEAHVLQPFLMGHIVALHPLAILLVIATGLVAGGIVGALLAVPLAACVNTIVRHLASGDSPDTDGLLGEESRDLGDPPPAPA